MNNSSADMLYDKPASETSSTNSRNSQLVKEMERKLADSEKNKMRSAGIEEGANAAYLDAASKIEQLTARSNGVIQEGSPEDLMYQRGMEQGINYQEPEGKEGGILDAIKSRLSSISNSMSEWGTNVVNPNIPSDQLQRQRDQEQEQIRYEADQRASAEQMKRF